MEDLNEFNTNLNNIYMIFFNLLSTFLSTDLSIYNTSNLLIKLLLLFCINNIYLINKLIIKIKDVIDLTKNKQEYINNRIKNIENLLYNKNIEILSLYNALSKKEEKNINYIPLLKKLTFNINKKNICNLDLYPLDEIDLSINNIIDPLINYNKDSNYIGFKKIHIGFNHYYDLHSYHYLNSNLPLNLLLYIQELDQVIIKVGNNKNYKYINSKLYKVYDSQNITYFNENKFNSILCNNNIKELNKKCYTDNCKYYHDYILGYSDNYHKTRYFSSNPIVFNCPSFKDGSKLKDNIKKIPWYGAINLYQSSLSNILISCIHSQYQD